MRLKIASSILAMGLLASSMAPANAVFGLTKCEKVKKQVLSLESEINKQSIYWNGKRSQKADLKLIPQLEAYDSSNLVGALWKLEYNNPKCFTRTQNIEIEARKNLKTGDLVNWYIKNVTKNTKKCNTVYQILSPTPDCILKKELQINAVYSLPTIYGY
jgi:hypothetical protein